MPDVAALGVAPVLADYSSISDDPDGGEGTPIAYPIDIVQCTAVQFLGKVALISGIAISARTLERFVEQCRPLLDSRCAALAVVAEQVGQPQASCHVEDRPIRVSRMTTRSRSCGSAAEATYSARAARNNSPVCMSTTNCTTLRVKIGSSP